MNNYFQKAMQEVFDSPKGFQGFTKTYIYRSRRLWQFTPLEVQREDQEEAPYIFRTQDGREFFFDRFCRLQRVCR